jgi:hypothetical protein
MRLWIAASLLFVLCACSRDPYSQESPQATLDAAKLMVKNGEAEKLPRLIHADRPEMRRWLNTLGRLMGDLESLSKTINEKYPQDVAALRAKAEQAAKEGRATSLIGQLVQQTRTTPRRGRGPDRSQQRDDFSDALARLFTDPYAFLDDAEGRLTVVEVDDETAAILWDEKPVLPPLGMVMRKGEDDKWFIVLPTNVPGAEKFLPKDKEQWEILGKLVVTLDKMTLDLEREVREGRHDSLRSVSRRAGEMTFVPAVMVVYAYGKYSEEK